MKIIIPFFTILLVSFLAFQVQAQESLATSKGLVGFWRQYVPVKNPQGEIVLSLTGNSKILNTDGSFINFINMKDRIGISIYGNYIITSDSTYTESITRAITPSLNGTTTQLFFKLKDNNTLLLRFYLETENGGKKTGNWFQEIWRRVEVFAN